MAKAFRLDLRGHGHWTVSVLYTFELSESQLDQLHDLDWLSGFSILSVFKYTAEDRYVVVLDCEESSAVWISLL